MSNEYCNHHVIGVTLVSNSAAASSHLLCILFSVKGNDDIYICGLDMQGLVRVQRAYSTGERKPNTLDLVRLLSLAPVVVDKLHFTL